MVTSTFQDLLQVLFPIRVQHLIGFVDDYVLQATKGQDLRTADEVNEATRGTNQDVASLLCKAWS